MQSLLASPSGSHPSDLHCSDSPRVVPGPEAREGTFLRALLWWAATNLFLWVALGWGRAGKVLRAIRAPDKKQGTGGSHWDIISWPGLGDLQCLSPTLHRTPKLSESHFGTQARLPGFSSCSSFVFGPKAALWTHPFMYIQPFPPKQAERIKRPCSGLLQEVSVLSHEPCSR